MTANTRIAGASALPTRRPGAPARTPACRSPGRASWATLLGGLAGVALGAAGVIAAPTVDVPGEETPFASARADHAGRLSGDPSTAVTRVLAPAGTAVVIAPAPSKPERP
jgi:hypothetical protein